jgi:hypothetical protein
VVRSVWLSSPESYDVDFHEPGEPSAVRAPIRAEHLEVIELSLKEKPIGKTGVSP